MAAMRLDGSFGEPSYISIGDPYKNPTEDKVHHIPGSKQFLTTGPKEGQTGSNWGPGPRKFVGLSGSYQEAYKLESQYRLENTKKNVKPNGFVFSSHTKKKQVGDGNRRNVLTSPVKKGTLGYTGTLIGGKSIPAMAAEFDSVRNAARKDMQYHKEKLGERKAFKSMSHELDYFDTNDHVAASRVYEWDDDCVKKPPEREELMNPKERAMAHAATYKSWKPTHAGKDGEPGTFEKFPERMPDPYDERVVTRAMLPNRRNPVEVATADLPESIRERKAFKPSSFPKKKFTKSTCLLGINKHKL
ncbi:unnamed protein product [Aphanomyces euteiches]